MAKSNWSFSDKLALTLACLAAILAIVLAWMEKTSGWALFTVLALAALVVYPIYHFCPNWKSRIPCLLVVWGLIAWFGHGIWPHKVDSTTASNPVGNRPQPPPAAPTSPTSLTLLDKPKSHKPPTVPQQTESKKSEKIDEKRLIGTVVEDCPAGSFPVDLENITAARNGGDCGLEITGPVCLHIKGNNYFYDNKGEGMCIKAGGDVYSKPLKQP